MSAFLQLTLGQIRHTVIAVMNLRRTVLGQGTIQRSIASTPWTGPNPDASREGRG
jgi:hypothetical protein